jgi:hypothetical protein
MCGNFTRENWEIPLPPLDDGTSGRTGKAKCHIPVMYGDGKSDSLIVPTKRSNKTM